MSTETNAMSPAATTPKVGTLILRFVGLLFVSVTLMAWIWTH